MISKLSHAGLRVLDQDEALCFYTEKLGDNSGNWFSLTQRAAVPAV